MMEEYEKRVRRLRERRDGLKKVEGLEARAADGLGDAAAQNGDGMLGDDEGDEDEDDDDGWKFGAT